MYAKWALTCTVTFDLNGGTLISGETVQTVEYGASANAPLVEREGAVFDGWDKTFDDIKADTTVTAIWTIATYLVIFDGNGGELQQGDITQYVTHGEDAIFL
ncbi:MAG: hypothetical protein EOM87_06690 [Clostridia bacterium]|nr:hypothetical protein [Clostridia bacterium]